MKKTKKQKNKMIPVLTVGVVALVVGFSIRIVQEKAMIHSTEMLCHQECDTMYDPNAGEEMGSPQILEFLNARCKEECTSFITSAECMNFPKP